MFPTNKNNTHVEFTSKRGHVSTDNYSKSAVTNPETVKIYVLTKSVIQPTSKCS